MLITLKYFFSGFERGKKRKNPIIHPEKTPVSKILNHKRPCPRLDYAVLAEEGFTPDLISNKIPTEDIATQKDDIPYESPEEKSKPKQEAGAWKEAVCEELMVVGLKSLSIMRAINTFIGKLSLTTVRAPL